LAFLFKLKLGEKSIRRNVMAEEAQEEEQKGKASQKVGFFI
jgi:hypothetical protein